MKNNPDYKKIYSDMIALKYPGKTGICESILKKEELDTLDIIKLNNLLTEASTEGRNSENQKLKSYDKATVFKILDYQKKHHLNNALLAKHFNMSRNTVANWKKLYFSKK